jgi:hypothetical protein
VRRLGLTGVLTGDVGSKLRQQSCPGFPWHFLSESDNTVPFVLIFPTFKF